MTSNRKIINATPVEADGIKFKSKMELLVYKTLVDKGYHPAYEARQFTLMVGGRPQFLVLKDGKKDASKIRDITYTPDFSFIHGNCVVFVEVKGWQNDTYAIKKKLFLNHLMEHYGAGEVAFFEVHSKKGLLACLEHLNSL